MIRTALLALFLLGIALPARGEPLWLVVGATASSPAEIAGSGRPFADLFPRGLVVQTSDCGEAKNVFAWVAVASASLEAAEEALSRLRMVSVDAYLKRCDVKPGTLLASRVSAVDDSIANVPDWALNGTGLNWVSSAHPLPDGRDIFVERYFVDDEHSELAGWRERVMLSDSDGAHELEVDCKDAGGFATRDGRLAFHCGQEWVAQLLLHAVVVYDEHGRQLHYIEHCRDPVWSGVQTIKCTAERVTPEGELELHEQEVALPAEIAPEGPPERLWLAIGASDATPGGIARQAKSLSARFPNGFVVQTSDCGAADTMFAWVAEASVSAEAAEAALAQLRIWVKDAYVKPCDARPGTVLAMRMNAVDASVAEMQDWGWPEWDGVSSMHPLRDSRFILIPRIFEISTNGDFASLREAVFIKEPSGGTPRLLVDDCSNPGHFITQGDLLAFDCAQEVFADFLVYGVLVFDRAGRQLAKVERCRYPIWSGDHVIACRKQVWDSWPKEHTLIRTVIGE